MTVDLSSPRSTGPETSSQPGARLVPVAPFSIVIFGGTGDLALRKILPALFHRWCDGQVPDTSRIIAVSRSEISTEDYLETVRARLAETSTDETAVKARFAEFARLVTYHAGDVLDGGFDWAALSREMGPETGNVCLFYLALPPGLFGPVCERLKAAGLNAAGARIVLEKPIGEDLASAKAINDAVGAAFEEHAIFRIDHYLGKETVQNLLVLRFANSLFEPMWNSKGVDHVQITVAETVGAGERTSYYDGAGALRDMVQNHLLQLLCLVAMEPPRNLEADAVRDEKLKVLAALRPIGPEDASSLTVHGQYGAGAMNGAAVPGYVEEIGHASRTETFVAVKAFIDNWRWANTPFYLRTGKRMPERHSEIVVQFHPVPHQVVKSDSGRARPNRLVIRLQPDEGVKLLLTTKDPGPGGMRLRYVPLNLSYADTFGARYPDAYERLLMAVVRDDLSLFMRRDEVEAAWRWIDTVGRAWESDETELYRYAAGSAGPAAAATLLHRDDREWFDELN